MAYNPALDGLRALAVVLVVAFHCRVPGFQGGFFGVDLFFVLSGYLITTLLATEYANEGRIALPRFYWNRLLRLTPPLFAMLTAVGLLGMASARELAVAGLYLGDIYYPWLGLEGAASSTRHTWSLAIEEHFYLIWPLLLPAILRRRNPARLLLILFGIATLWRAATWPLAPAQASYFRLDAQLSGLVLGSTLAIWKPTIAPGSLRWIQASALVVLALATVYSQIYSWKSEFYVQTAVELAALGLICAACDAGTWLHRLLSLAPLVRTGVWSYAIYLWHFPIAWALRHEEHSPAVTATTVLASVALGALTHGLIERPLRAFRMPQSSLRHAPATGMTGAAAGAPPG